MNISDKLSSASNSADRMGDSEVVSTSYAKTLIREAFSEGIRTAVDCLRKRNDSCNCADALDALAASSSGELSE